MLGRKKDEKYYLTHYTDEELKAAQEKMQEKAEQDAKTKHAGLTAHFRDAMDDAMAMSAENVRRKYRPRWRKLCGVETDEEIDYNDPVVSTEWLLCDPRVQRDLIQGRRADVLARMTEQQQ